MASPTYDARIRLNEYQPIRQGNGGSAKDLIFRLKVTRSQKDLTDGAKVLSTGDFYTNTLVFSQVRFIITLEGVVVEDGTHSAHPVSASTEHDPDWIDLEEMGVLWNSDVPDNFPQLEIQYNGSAWRVYKGVIQELTLLKTAGHKQANFKLVFGVVWSADNPTLREWSS